MLHVLLLLYWLFKRPGFLMALPVDLMTHECSWSTPQFNWVQYLSWEYAPLLFNTFQHCPNNYGHLFFEVNRYPVIYVILCVMEKNGKIKMVSIFSAIKWCFVGLQLHWLSVRWYSMRFCRIIVKWTVVCGWLMFRCTHNKTWLAGSYRYWWQCPTMWSHLAAILSAILGSLF